VASFLPNPFGLYDMHGNVWEYVADCWHSDYTNAPDDGRAWMAENDGDCSEPVVRGGSWNFDPRRLRSAFRFRYLFNERYFISGFRLARTLR
jgi:formylglycine-generating enzyme required for sulfatase activity